MSMQALSIGEAVRPPAVAGQFYPDNPKELRATVESYLSEAAGKPHPAKALIVPHAGYVYSGPIAASAYACLRARAQSIERVVLLGPSHRVGFYGIAAPTADYFQTPLGRVPVDQEAIERIIGQPTVFRFDDAHRNEHSLEVQIPFLQVLLGEFALVPLVVGSATADEVAGALDVLWGGPETLIVVSSDLSHYLDYATARRVDAQTSEAIVRLRSEEIHAAQACGHVPVQGLLLAARRKGLGVEVLDLRNSGDTAGPRHQVVGYGAYALR